LEVMKDIPDGSIDMILTDPPFNVTACKWEWDIMTRINEFWEQWKRIIKENGAIVIFGIEPFSSKLRVSHLEMYKYDWVWEREQGSIPCNAPYQPINVHSQILIFSKMASTYSSKGTMKYFPQKIKGEPYKASQSKKREYKFHSDICANYIFKGNEGYRYPRSVIKFKTERGKHPTQKPVKLLEYLIKTYTLKNETVLDCFMGSGSTIIAALNTDRKAIGIELDENYFKIAKKRIKDHLGLFAD